MKFEERVLQQEFKLNDTDDEIVSYIRIHKKELQTLSIQKIAEELYIVPNAIMRFCKKIGYSGFAEMKFLMQNEVDAIQDVNKLLARDLYKSIELVNYKTLEEVAIKIHSLKTCHFIGVGESLYFCEMMTDNLRCFNYKADCYPTYREIEYRIEHATNKDMLFVISASGENKRINEWIELAHKRGVFIVTLTYFDENFLASLADIPLYFWGKEQKLNGYNVTDRTGMMMILRELTEVFWKMYCV